LRKPRTEERVAEKKKQTEVPGVHEWKKKNGTKRGIKGRAIHFFKMKKRGLVG